MEDRIVHGISHFLACNIGDIPFKFLGVPVGSNPRRVSTWQPIIDSIKVRLSGWRSKQLSIGGRVTLINSVLSALPLYLFSFYKAPKKVIEEITKLQRRFLWGGSNENRRMAWVNWDTVCLPKDKGGLGVKNIEAFNVALLTKWRWRFLTEDNIALWKNVVVGRYGVKERWPDPSECRRDWGKKSLWWRDLCILGEGTNLVENWFNEVVKIKVGKGNLSRFWLDRWLGRDSIADLFPEIYSSCNTKTATVSDMGSWAVNRWRWRWDWATDLAPNVAQNLNQLMDMVRDISPVAEVDDRWVWTLDIANGYTVKCCYNWLLSYFSGERGQIDEAKVEACRKLWRSDVPSKILIHAWRVLLNKTATRDALYRRGLLQNTNDSRCVLCSLETESVNHLYCSCVVAKSIWRKVYAWLGVSELEAEDIVTHFMEFGKLVKGKKARGVKHIVWLAVVWNLWLARNRNNFNGEGISISNIVSAVKHSAWGWFMARKGRNSGVVWSDWFNCPMGCIRSV